METKQRVLLVDDEPDMLFAMSRRLVRKFDVTLAMSANDALDKMEASEPFSVVVSDMHMPGADGLELLEKVREREPSTSRIMLTGCSDPDTAVDAVNQAGIFRFIRKPCTGDELSQAVMQGVVESRRRRDMLEAASRSENTTRYTAELFANLSHELRTPLNHIIGFAELLDDGLPNGALTHDYAKAIRQSGQALHRAVTGLLDFGATSLGHYKLKRELTSLAALADDCVQFVEPLCLENNLRLMIDVDRGEPDVFVDKDALKLALFNLLSNAVKYNQDGGSVLLSFGHDPHGNVKFLVADDGIGIPPENIDKVLDPFCRGETASLGNRGGLGIGLPLARALTELHGGRLQLESCLVKGTAVSIHLPAASDVRPREHELANVVAFPGRPRPAIYRVDHAVDENGSDDTLG